MGLKMRWRVWFVAFAACAAAAFGACRADDVVKQGIEGEVCNNRDDDCREGHICDQGVCRALDGTGSVTCAEMCRHLTDCNTGEMNCEADCRATLQGTCEGAIPCPWSADAIDSFGTCILDLSCEDAQAVDAPQQCYRDIPIPSDREARCEAFIAAADRCSPGVDTADLRNRCFLLGRTNTAQSWTRTDPCVARIEDGFCNEIEECFNSVFELGSDRIELGDDRIGGDDGDDEAPLIDGQIPG